MTSPTAAERARILGSAPCCTYDLNGSTICGSQIARYNSIPVGALDDAGLRKWWWFDNLSAGVRGRGGGEGNSSLYFVVYPSLH